MKTKGVFKRFSSLILLVFIVFILFTNLHVSGAQRFPEPTPNKYVNDYAGIIDEASARQIINLGYELEQKTGAQAIVVTVTDLESVPIETYANNLFRSWGIGQGNKDNGLLILLAFNEHSWRVEVGRGLEGAIPDALSNQVMLELAKPEFIQGNYGTGLAKAYSQFSDIIATEYDTTLTQSLGVTMPQSSVAPMQHRNNYIGTLAIIALIVIDLLFNRGRIFSFILQMLFWNSFFNQRGGPRGGGGGGFGGFGGGSSNGGGSSGSW